jgi:hypothetical protein
MNMRHCWKNVILPVLRNRREAPLRILWKRNVDFRKGNEFRGQFNLIFFLIGSLDKW